jgi:hypothetical protein
MIKTNIELQEPEGSNSSTQNPANGHYPDLLIPNYDLYNLCPYDPMLSFIPFSFSNNSPSKFCIQSSSLPF